MDTVKKVVHILSLIIYGLVSIYVVICIPMIFKYKPLVVLNVQNIIHKAMYFCALLQIKGVMRL